MSYHYDEECCLTEPGHRLLDADYYVAFSQSAVGIEVTATVGDGVIVLRGADSTARGWNHRHRGVAAALPESGVAADWFSTKQLIIVPPRGVGEWHSMFRVGALDERTPCLT